MIVNMLIMRVVMMMVMIKKMGMMKVMMSKYDDGDYNDDHV